MPKIMKKRDTVLVVIDNTQECMVALEFGASHVWRYGGKLALLTIMPVPSIYQWSFIAKEMKLEKLEEARKKLFPISKDIQARYGIGVQTIIKVGYKKKEVMKILHTNPSISRLILGAAVGKNPGELIQYLTKRTALIHTPIMVIPANITPEEVEQFV